MYKGMILEIHTKQKKSLLNCKIILTLQLSGSNSLFLLIVDVPSEKAFIVHNISPEKGHVCYFHSIKKAFSVATLYFDLLKKNQKFTFT